MSPAYLREIEKAKCAACNSRATVEVYNTRNAMMGRFCSQHGRMMVKRLQEQEQGR